MMQSKNRLAEKIENIKYKFDNKNKVNWKHLLLTKSHALGQHKHVMHMFVKNSIYYLDPVTYKIKDA